jgi:hypothetical protein
MVSSGSHSSERKGTAADDEEHLAAVEKNGVNEDLSGLD